MTIIGSLDDQLASLDASNVEAWRDNASQENSEFTYSTSNSTSYNSQVASSSLVLNDGMTTASNSDQPNQAKQDSPSCQAETASENHIDSSQSQVKYFVGGFNRDVTEESLRTWFSRFGPVSDIKIMRNPVSGQSRGFGFVTMVDPNSRQAIKKEREHIICGKRVSVRPYTEVDSKESFPEGLLLKRKIFVGGINPILGHDILVKFFEKFGPVEDASIMRYPDGRSRGFGFIVFKEETACQQALQQRNYFVTPRDKVEVKPCLSRVRVKAGMPVMLEPYHRYGQSSITGLSPPAMSHNNSASGYRYATGMDYYNQGSAHVYSQYSRASPYDRYSSHSNAAWAGNENRDWWGQYDNFGNVANGTSSYWRNSNYSGSILSTCNGYVMGAMNLSLNGNSLDHSSNQARGSAANIDVMYHEAAPGGVSALINGTGHSKHHSYGPLRRAGAAVPMMPMYSVSRSRGIH